MCLWETMDSAWGQGDESGNKGDDGEGGGGDGGENGGSASQRARLEAALAMDDSLPAETESEGEPVQDDGYADDPLNESRVLCDRESGVEGEPSTSIPLTSPVPQPASDAIDDPGMDARRMEIIARLDYLRWGWGFGTTL